MDFFIHVPTGTLLASRSSLTPLAELAISQRNDFAVRVWFLGNGPDVATPVQVQAIPAPYTRIVLSARQNDVLDEETLVFFLDDLTATGEGAELHYAGVLNTATAAAGDLFTAQDRRRRGCYLDIDLLVTADPDDGRWTLVKQRDFFLYRAMWQGTEGVEPDSVPAYPLPDALVTQAPGDGKLYGRRNGAWEEIIRSYELKSAGFTAAAARLYLVDTTSGGVTAALPGGPSSGTMVTFADARGTWGTHALTVDAGAAKIEGQAGIDFVCSAASTFFSMVYVDATTGWRVLASGTVPQNLTIPTITGNAVGGAVTSSPGTWTGSPTAYLYQWQRKNNRTAFEILDTAANCETEGVVLTLEDASTISIQESAGIYTWFHSGPDNESAAWSTPEEGATALSAILVLAGYTATADDARVVVRWLGVPEFTPESSSPDFVSFRNTFLPDWTNISGATTASFSPQAMDEDGRVRVRVTAANANGNSLPAFSAQSEVIVQPDFPSDGLIAFWNMDDLTDASGNGHDLTENGSLAVGPGKIGDAMTGLDPANHLSCVTAQIGGATSWSIACWIHPTVATATNHMLAGNSGYTSLYFMEHNLGIYSSLGHSTGYNAININEWAHVALVYDKAEGEARLYIDGALDSTVSASDIEPFTVWPGAISAIGSTEAFVGMLDAYGLWSRALTDSDIALLYNGGAGRQI